MNKLEEEIIREIELGLNEFKSAVDDFAYDITNKVVDYIKKETTNYQGDPNNAGNNFANAGMIATATFLAGCFGGKLKAPLVLAGLGLTALKAYHTYKDIESEERHE